MGSQAFETCPSLCCRAAPVSCLTTSLTIFSQAVQKIVPALLHSTLLLSNRLWEASCMAPCLLIPLAWKERSGRPASLLPFAALFLVAPNKVVSLASTCIFLILFPPSPALHLSPPTPPSPLIPPPLSVFFWPLSLPGLYHSATAESV